MSVEAISWALNLAPVPADSNGQPSSRCKFVLVGLANHAGPDGTGAFPSVATLVRYTGLSERTVRTCLDRLEADGIIRPCDPAVIAARIRRADRRPKGWDLDLTLIRGDLTNADVPVLERQFPGLAGRLAAAGLRTSDCACDGVQPPHPDPDTGQLVDNPAIGVQLLHPADATGCSRRVDGVQLAQSRGAAAAPEPSPEPSIQPPAAGALGRDAPAAHQPSGGIVGEFFDGLGPGCQLTAGQQARLAGSVSAVLESGWSPAALAAFTGGNTKGIRSPFAVLAARLAPDQIPCPPPRGAVPPARRPWCGQCDHLTRMLDFDGDAPRPCPDCKPKAVALPDRGRDDGLSGHLAPL